MQIINLYFLKLVLASIVKRLSNMKSFKIKSKSFVIKKILVEKLKKLNINKKNIDDQMFYQNFIYRNLKSYVFAARIMNYLNYMQNLGKICDKNRQSLLISNEKRFLFEQDDFRKYFQFLIFIFQLNEQFELSFKFKEDTIFKNNEFNKIEIYRADLAPVKKIRFSEIIECTQHDDEIMSHYMLDEEEVEDEEYPAIYEPTQQFQYYSGGDNQDIEDCVVDSNEECFLFNCDSLFQTQPFSIYFNTQPFLYNNGNQMIASSQIPSYQVLPNSDNIEFVDKFKAQYANDTNSDESSENADCVIPVQENTIEKIKNLNVPTTTSEALIVPTTMNEDFSSSINQIDCIVPSLETQSKRGKKRKQIKVGLSKRQRFAKPLHSNLNLKIEN